MTEIRGDDWMTRVTGTTRVTGMTRVSGMTGRIRDD